jgi:hypothetical protein
MKTTPETGLRSDTSTTEVIKFPKAIARPSTIRNARKTPRKIFPYFFVLEERSRIETWVLSPNSAKAIAIKGMMISSKMVLTDSYTTAAAEYDNTVNTY